MSKHAFQHPLSKVMPSRPRGPMRVPARALGWFSIALGLAALAVPRGMARVAGAPNVPLLTRACGVREIGTGIGILASKDPTPWIRGRVVGDALDIVAVGAGLVTRRRPVRTLTTLALLAGVAWLDHTIAEAASPEKKRAKHALRDYSGRSGFPRPAEQMRGIAQRPSARLMPAEGTPPRTEDARSALASAVAGAAS